MATTWLDAHDCALRKYVQGGGHSFAEAAAAINREFGTAYSRNACIGRATRSGYSGPYKPKVVSGARMPRIRKPRESKPQGAQRSVFKIIANGNGNRIFHSSESVTVAKLRCVEVDPRLLTFAELEENDCRYPYGESESASEFRFCGHPKFIYQRAGLKVTSSYCGPHFSLSIGNGTTSERIATHGIAA